MTTKPGAPRAGHRRRGVTGIVSIRDVVKTRMRSCQTSRGSGGYITQGESPGDREQRRGSTRTRADIGALSVVLRGIHSDTVMQLDAPDAGLRPADQAHRVRPKNALQRHGQGRCLRGGGSSRDAVQRRQDITLG